MFSVQVKALMQQLADLLTKRVDAEDGGPGSGNWGHKGRPGQVGGSGKGGGNQYRGGKAGILYTSSKSDWLNGLTGEKQNKASKFMQSMEKLKKPGQSTEAFIMENGTSETGASAVKEYLDLKGEARGWDKYAKRLMDENLDENDKKIVNALTLKYGIMYKGNATLPDPVGMEGDDLRTWNDLKSKAMGGPTSGLEPSDELMITAGLKEAPKAKAPESRAENDGWMKGISTEEQQRLRTLLGTSENRSITAAEQEAGDSLNFSAGRQELANFNQYLNEKAKLLGVDYPSILVSGQSSGTLRDDQTKAMADVLQTKLDEINLRDGTNLTLPDDIDRAEQEMFSVNDFYWTQTYLRLKANALGTAPFNSYSTDRDIGSLNKWKDRIEKNIASMQMLQAMEKSQRACKERFNAKTHSERVSMIDSAQKTKDLAQTMHDIGLFHDGAEIKFGRCDLTVAKGIAKSYNMVAEKYPFMIGQWNAFEQKHLSDRTYAQAYMVRELRDPYAGKIEVNSSYFKDLQTLKKKYEGDIAKGFHPAGTDYTAIATHEIGHTLESWLNCKGLKQKLGADVSKYLKDKVCTTFGVKPYLEEIQKQVSGYAAKNPVEWFAECFAEAMHSPNPRPMAAEMMRQLDQILKEEGLIQ